MDRNTAERISDLLRQHLPDSASFRLEEELETPLVNFHQWADGKDCVGAFRVASETSERNLLLIQWSDKHLSRFHLVLFPANRSGPLLEVHEIRGGHFNWTHSPTRHDGRNSERKERFSVLAQRHNLTLVDSRVAIPVPTGPDDVEPLLSTVFLLADVRTEADDLDQRTQVPTPPLRGPQPSEPRYWLMSLGPRSRHWEECRREGIACLGWDELGDLTEYASRAAMDLGRNDSLACWQFCHDMEPGDTIFAKLGTSAVVGHGTVTSAYRFDATRPAYKNVREVDWHSNFPGGVRVRDKPLVLKTLTDVSDYPQQVVALKRAVGMLASLPETEAEPPYSVDSILEDGCFLDRGELDVLLNRLETKKNLVLQGPPGTGKTWLAKRLAYALTGRRDRERICNVQFHPTLSYEDFVIGWRPSASGLELTKGTFLRVIESASADPETPFVVVIEEINRGNPAQIFGELITLLEADKRSADEGLELSYAAEGEATRVHVPENLYVIGTMNIADRSLALVDLALRRRFAFATLKPRIDDTWRRWVTEQLGIDAEAADDIQHRMAALNEEIAASKSLGEQFCIGHSYVTPTHRLDPDDVNGWFRDVVETELAPLLEEYWFDEAGRARQEHDRLLKDW